MWMCWLVLSHYNIGTDSERERMEGREEWATDIQGKWFSANNCDLHAIRFHSQINEWVMNVLEIQMRSIEIRFAFWGTCNVLIVNLNEHNTRRHRPNMCTTHTSTGASMDTCTMDFHTSNVDDLCNGKRDRANRCGQQSIDRTKRTAECTLLKRINTNYCRNLNE